MNQTSLGFLETMTVVYKLSKLDPHLQDICSLVWEIMKIHTQVSFNTGPRAKSERYKAIGFHGRGDLICRWRRCWSGGAVIPWSAQRRKSVALLEGAEGAG